MHFSSTLQIALITGFMAAAAPVLADTCDYRPSRILGDSGSAAVIGGGVAVASSTGAAPLRQGSCPPLYFSSISQVGGIGRRFGILTE